LLTHSYYAKLLATRKPTQNTGKRTAGVDGETWSSSEAKMKAALSLTDKKYVAKPLKRVYIEKYGSKKKRPLGIPTMYDRAMQSLYALALEPIAEATGDKTSFGFRKFRSYVFERQLFPTEAGTPQGGIISPILANLTLDGIEKILADKYHKTKL
jgi:RNA-directed DNA polymerase